MPYPVRDRKGPDNSELFLVSAISTIVMVRVFLYLTGYPQLGGGELHIAHMLWGGLLMLTSIIMFMSFLSRQSRWLASFVGGVGFGLFIDEVGKFVTADNNYFFSPSFAIMYGIFVLAFLSFRLIQNRVIMTKDEKKLNLILDEYSVITIDKKYKLANLINKLIINTKTRFNQLITTKLATFIVLGYFLINALYGIIVGLNILHHQAQWTRKKLLGLNPSEFNQLESAAFLGYTLIIIIGSYFFIRKEYSRAYPIYRYSTYYAIFVLQFFAFLHNQLVALVGFLFFLMVLNVVKHLESNQ